MTEDLDPKALEAAESAYLQREGGGFVPSMRAAIRAYLASLPAQADGTGEVVAEWQVWAEDDFGISGWVNEDAGMIEHWRSKGRKVRALYASPPAPLQEGVEKLTRYDAYHHVSNHGQYVLYEAVAALAARPTGGSDNG
jgi:hypothetical protein